MPSCTSPPKTPRGPGSSCTRCTAMPGFRRGHSTISGAAGRYGGGRWGGGRAVRACRGAGAAGGDGPRGRGTTAGRTPRPRPLRGTHDRPAAALVLTLRRGAVRADPGGWRGGGARAGDRGGQQGGVRPHGGHLLEEARGDRALLRRDRSRRVLREQADGCDHWRVAGGAAVHGLEGIGLDGEGRVRAVLCRAVPAGAEPDRDRGVAMKRDYPRIVVAPPGPKAKAIVERQNRWSSTSYPKEYPLTIARGEGAMVEDVDGNRYLDFMAGIAVASTGYGHPKVVQAIQEAAGRFLHICGSDFYFESFAALCERLAQLAPGKSKKRVFLSNSGTEAVEGAIKLARHSTGRPAIVAFTGAFHGRTYGGLSLTASKSIQRAGFAPFLPEVYHVPYGYGDRCECCLGGFVCTIRW